MSDAIAKVKTWPILLALGLAAGFFYITFHNPSVTDGDRERPVHLSVIFEGPHGKTVYISATADGVPVSLALEPTAKTPWGRDVLVPPGSRVILAVMQEKSGRAECTILQNGTIKDHNYMVGPGSMSCQHVVEW